MIFEPKPCDLSEVMTAVPTPKGIIASRFTKDKGHVLVIPEGIELVLKAENVEIIRY